PILRAYRTSNDPVGVWLSDSSRLSDKQHRFLLRLSDSSRLSDKQCSKRIALVRFFETATFIYLCTC
ncbi:MAG: hypothetical protein WAW83_03975, partial [Trichococcus flocculiformis]